MCGIVGLATTEPWDSKRRNVFMEALFADTFRGYDSTGLALVKKKEEKEPAQILKHIMTAPEFLQWPPVLKAMKDFDDYKYVIGHNRAATAARVSKQNAHPFQVDHITLVHNGTINNSEYDLGVKNSPANVDSAFIAAAFAIVGVKETLEKLRGGFALVWHDAKDGTINFARNNAKPLSWCYEEKKNTMYWASEGLMLYWLLDRNEVKVDGKFRVASPMVWYKFNPEDFREWQRIPFEQRPTPTVATGGDQRWVGGAKRMETPPSNPHGDQHGTTNTATGDKKEENTNVPFEKGETCILTSPTLFEQSGGAGRPGNPRKLANTRKNLINAGFVYEKLVRMSADSFVPYKNQQGKRGTIVGKEKTKQVFCEVHNVSRALWEALLDAGHYKSIYGRVVNHKKGRKGEPILVIELDAEKMNKFVFNPAGRRSLPELSAEGSDKEPVLDHTKLAPALKEEEARKGSSFPSRRDDDPVHDGGEEEESTLYCGPFGRLISLSEFESRTSSGCGYCGGFINPKFHQAVGWVGDGCSTAICHECSEGGKYLEALGLRSVG